MIPAHNQSGVLPPFIPGSLPTRRDAMAPYRVSLMDVADKFAHSERRVNILQGLVEYRRALRSVGITQGFQWLDGSFVEKVESTRGRPPNDIDIVTFSYRPDAAKNTDAWRRLIESRADLFDPEESKKRYFCDAYFVDMEVPAPHLVNQTKYWFGLFSHQRETALWKGMLEVSLAEDETDVLAFLNRGDCHAA